jgi:phage baseplate assembly protein W
MIQEKTCYRLPLEIGRFFTEDDGRMELCTEPESIDGFLNLLITTCAGEHSFNPEFGTHIRELDFENITSPEKWEERFTEYVRHAVTACEKRLGEVRVRIVMQDAVCEESITDTVNIRKRVDIFITGVIVSSGVRCRFGHTIYLGPLSGD